MEAKDLILLLMIPVFLIGIISFVNHNTITGNAVAAPNDNEKLGTYSILPSFRAKIDYSLQDYADLKNKLKAAIDKCINNGQQDVRSCIKAGTDSYGWSCNEKDSDVLYDFTDKMKECINLENENVVCRFSFDSRDYLNKEKSKRDFQIKLTSWYYPRIKAELIENDKVLATEFVEIGQLAYTDYESKDKEGKSMDSVIIKVNYDDEIPSVQDAYGATIGEKLSKIFLIYKSKSGIKFIDQRFESSFRGPEPANTVIDLPLMQGLKFCAKTGKNVIAYDSSDGLVKPREIIYKFAITLPNPVPAPVGEFDAKDNLKAENSALLVWKKDSQAGIKSYSVYYSTNDFADRKMSDIKKDNSIKKISASSGSPIEIDRIGLDSCEFNPINEPCKYAVYNQALLKNKLYYIKSENKFVYVLSDDDFKDGIDYNIAVTAVNGNGEEIDNDKSISNNKNILENGKNYLQFSPIDDLAPGKVENLQASSLEKGKIKLTWNLPAKNIDGSDNKDAYAFNAYYKEQQIASNSLPVYDRVIGSILKSSCDGKPSCEYTFNSLSSGRNYIFAVTSIDLNKNEYFVDGGYSTVTGTVQ